MLKKLSKNQASWGAWQGHAHFSKPYIARICIVRRTGYLLVKITTVKQKRNRKTKNQIPNLYNSINSNLVQSYPDLPCPDLPGTPIYRGHFLSPNTVHLQVFSVKQNPDLLGSPIYRDNFISPENPGNSGFDCST